MPIRQYLLDKVLPGMTEAMVTYTDKIDFSKIDVSEVTDKKLIDEDPLDFLIDYLEVKAAEYKMRVEEAIKRKQESMRKARAELTGSEAEHEEDSGSELSYMQP